MYLQHKKLLQQKVKQSKLNTQKVLFDINISWYHQSIGYISKPYM